MRISDWSSDVCASDLSARGLLVPLISSSVEQGWQVVDRPIEVVDDDHRDQHQKQVRHDTAADLHKCHMRRSDALQVGDGRSEERREGKGRGSKGRSRGELQNRKKRKNT